MRFNNFFTKHGGKIFAGLGIAGAIGTVGFAIYEGEKAQRKLVNKLIEDGKLDGPDERYFKTSSFMDRIKKFVLKYWRTGLCGLTTIGSIVGSGYFSRRNEVYLMSLIASAEAAYHGYRQKVKEIDGEGVDEFFDRAVKDEHKDIIDGKLPWDDTQTFYLDIPGVAPRFEQFTMMEVRLAELEFNRLYKLNKRVTLNDYLDILHLPHVECGDKLYFDEKDGPKWIYFNYPQRFTDDGELFVTQINMLSEPSEGL